MHIRNSCIMSQLMRSKGSDLPARAPLEDRELLYLVPCSWVRNGAHRLEFTPAWLRTSHSEAPKTTGSPQVFWTLGLSDAIVWQALRGFMWPRRAQVCGTCTVRCARFLFRLCWRRLKRRPVFKPLRFHRYYYTRHTSVILSERVGPTGPAANLSPCVHHAFEGNTPFFRSSFRHLLAKQKV